MSVVRSIGVRLILTYLVLIFFSTTVTYMFFLPRFRDYVDRRTEQQLVAESRVLSNLIRDNSMYANGNLLMIADDLRREFADVEATRVRLYDTEGTLIADTRRKRLPDPPPTLPPEGREALRGQQRTWVEDVLINQPEPAAQSVSPEGKPPPYLRPRHPRQTDHVSTQTGHPAPTGPVHAQIVHVTVPLGEADRLDGVVDVSTVIADRVMTSDIRRLMGMALVVSILASLGVSLLLSKTITGPIERLRGAADRIAGGDLSHRVAVGGDELGRLGAAINHMAMELESRIGQIVGQKNTMNSLLATLLDGVVALDRDHRVQFLNRVAEIMLATRADVAIGQPLDELCRPLDLSHELTECLASKQRQSREGELGNRTVKFYLLPFEDELHQHLGTMVVLHDVTELRRLEEARVQFFGSVSHELRTPLTIIKGFASHQLDNTLVVNDAELRRSLEVIDRETDRLARLVDDILELSRLRS